ncbi:Hypothetical predicted protein [Pelobates cultripes]|uniref:Uncharacterized protein n=1 Tax=Pelobates cultripes TaxID=61616 RepID=A0AAD1S8W1_PELCU|nr:Hypothetical predicted protein [Pelobates cultripes]
MATMLRRPWQPMDPEALDWVQRLKARFVKLCLDFWSRLACSSHTSAFPARINQHMERSCAAASLPVSPTARQSQAEIRWAKTQLSTRKAP